MSLNKEHRQALTPFTNRPSQAPRGPRHGNVPFGGPSEEGAPAEAPVP